MARTLRDLSKAMMVKADKVVTCGSRLAVIGTTAAVEALVYMTPVDTSEHLSNWQVNLNNPAPDALPPYFPGSKGSTRGASAAQAVEAAKAELEFKKPGQVIYISNLAPAIGELDRGSSTQFPGGFVPKALVVFREAVTAAAPSILK